MHLAIDPRIISRSGSPLQSVCLLGKHPFIRSLASTRAAGREPAFSTCTPSATAQRGKVTTALPGRRSAGTCNNSTPRQGLAPALDVFIACPANGRIHGLRDTQQATIETGTGKTPKTMASSAPSYHDAAESSKAPRRPRLEGAHGGIFCSAVAQMSLVAAGRRRACRSHALEMAALPPACLGTERRLKRESMFASIWPWSPT